MERSDDALFCTSNAFTLDSEQFICFAVYEMVLPPKRFKRMLNFFETFLLFVAFSASRIS